MQGKVWQIKLHDKTLETKYIYQQIPVLLLLTDFCYNTVASPSVIYEILFNLVS